MASRPDRHPAEPPEPLPPELAEFCRRLAETVLRKREQRQAEAVTKQSEGDGDGENG